MDVDRTKLGLAGLESMDDALTKLEIVVLFFTGEEIRFVSMETGSASVTLAADADDDIITGVGRGEVKDDDDVPRSKRSDTNGNHGRISSREGILLAVAHIATGVLKSKSKETLSDTRSNGASKAEGKLLL